jgi:hypothetical protein
MNVFQIIAHYGMAEEMNGTGFTLVSGNENHVRRMWLKATAKGYYSITLRNAEGTLATIR